MSARLESLLDPERRAACEANETKPEYPQFVGWMLWNSVRAQHESRGIAWPMDRYGGIFEDMPQVMQDAWNQAAAELQLRAKMLGRLA